MLKCLKRCLKLGSGLGIDQISKDMMELFNMFQTAETYLFYIIECHYCHSDLIVFTVTNVLIFSERAVLKIML